MHKTRDVLKQIDEINTQIEENYSGENKNRELEDFMKENTQIKKHRQQFILYFTLEILIQ